MPMSLQVSAIGNANAANRPGSPMSVRNSTQRTELGSPRGNGALHRDVPEIVTRTISDSKTRVEKSSPQPQTSLELLTEKLRLAEQKLVEQHEGVVQLVQQIIEENRQAQVRSPVSNFSNGRNWEKEHDVPIRPDFQLGSVPSPPTDAPRMCVPGNAVEEADVAKPELAVVPARKPDDLAGKIEHFELHEVFLEISKKRVETHRSKQLHTAAWLKRQSRVDMYDDDMNTQQNLSDGCSKHFFLHPNNFMRSFWDIGSMLLVLYDMIMVPFGFFEPEPNPFMSAMEWVTRLFWTADIPMSFISGYVGADGTIEMRPGPISKKYIKSWFLMDIGVVSADWTEIVMGQAMEGMDMARMGKATRIFRILRMIRLLRLAKVGEIVNLLAERLPSEKFVVFIDILKLIVIMLGIGHLLACIWYIVGKDMGPENRSDWTWLLRYGFAAEDLEYKYIMSLRWALSQFAGGMDEVTPVSLAEHVYAGIVYICAFWSGTVFLSILTSHFTQLYILGNQQSQQLNVMRRYLNQNGISKGLVLRVTRNAQHTMKMRQRATPEAAVGLIDLVSEPLRIELHYEMYFPMLGLHPFFADYMKACPFVVRKICHAAMATSTFSRDDVIFHFGEAAREMLVIRSGCLAYSWGASSSENLGEGRWLSEAPLWTHWAHRGVLTATEDSIVFSVNAQKFQNIIGMFELAVFDPSHYAVKFVRELNSVSAEELTDLPVKNVATSRWAVAGRVSNFQFKRANSRVSAEFMEDDDEEAEETDGTDAPKQATRGSELSPRSHFSSNSSETSKRRSGESQRSILSRRFFKDSRSTPLQEIGKTTVQSPRNTDNLDLARRVQLEDLCKEEEV